MAKCTFFLSSPLFHGAVTSLWWFSVYDHMCWLCFYIHLLKNSVFAVLVLNVRKFTGLDDLYSKCDRCIYWKQQFQFVTTPFFQITVWEPLASSHHVFLCASAGSLPLLTSVKLWKPARVKSVLICVMEGAMPLLVWWCHGMRHRQTQSFLAGCLETPPLFSIYHLGVTFPTINLSTWNLESNLKLRRREMLLIQAAKYPIPP